MNRNVSIIDNTSIDGVLFNPISDTFRRNLINNNTNLTCDNKKSGFLSKRDNNLFEKEIEQKESIFASKLKKHD